jgi:hypothetical protein
MNRRGVVLLLMTVLAVCGAGASLVAAVPPDRTFTRTTTLFLSAYSPETGINLNVYRLEGGMYEVCVFMPTGSLGCTAVDSDAFTVSKNLFSASLTSTMITIPICSGDDSGYPICTYEKVPIAVTFEGTGDLQRFQSHYKSSNGCRMMGSTKGEGRDGEAMITLDGQSYTAFAFLVTSTNTFRMQCKH